MPHATTQVVTALSRAIRRNSDELAAAWPRARRGDRRAVHRVRVASRRLRAALPLAAAIGAREARALAREWRAVTRALGGVREVDVVHALLQASATRLGWAPAAVAHMEAQCAVWRAARLSSLRARLSRTDAADLADASRAVADAVAPAAPGAAALVAMCATIGRRARRFVAALHDAGTVYAAEPLHQLRLAGKKLRYTLEAAGGPLGGSPDRLRCLERFQDALGRIHDAQTAQRYVRIAAAAPGLDRALTSGLADMDRALEIRCRRLHALALRARPEVDETAREILQAVAERASPRFVGRMARMRAVRLGRRRAVGA